MRARRWLARSHTGQNKSSTGARSFTNERAHLRRFLLCNDSHDYHSRSHYRFCLSFVCSRVRSHGSRDELHLRSRDESRFSRSRLCCWELIRLPRIPFHSFARSLAHPSALALEARGRVLLVGGRGGRTGRLEFRLGWRRAAGWHASSGRPRACTWSWGEMGEQADDRLAIGVVGAVGARNQVQLGPNRSSWLGSALAGPRRQLNWTASGELWQHVASGSEAKCARHRPLFILLDVDLVQQQAPSKRTRSRQSPYG